MAYPCRARRRLPQRLPAPELIEERWRVVGPSGRVVTCAVYRIEGPGLVVRAGYSFDQFHCTRRVAGVADARMLAETWRTTVISIGYTELTL